MTSFPKKGKGKYINEIASGQRTSIETPEGVIKVRKQASPSGWKIMVTGPDGNEISVKGGGSTNKVLSAIITAGLGMKGIGYNVDPTRDANVSSKMEELGLTISGMEITPRVLGEPAWDSLTGPSDSASSDAP